eukprot:gene4116-biopygen1896
MHPEMEKPGLLRPRPLVGTVEEDGKPQMGGSRGPEGRRPADVFLPRWNLGLPACLDFAVTSGLRMGSLAESAADGSAPTTSYAVRKRSFLDTDSHCRDEGLSFIPMIMEASGGSWGPDARKMFHELSKAAARLTGDPPAGKRRKMERASPASAGGFDHWNETKTLLPAVGVGGKEVALPNSVGGGGGAAVGSGFSQGSHPQAGVSVLTQRSLCRCVVPQVRDAQSACDCKDHEVGVLHRVETRIVWDRRQVRRRLRLGPLPLIPLLGQPLEGVQQVQPRPRHPCRRPLAGGGGSGAVLPPAPNSAPSGGALGAVGRLRTVARTDGGARQRRDGCPPRGL